MGLGINKLRVTGGEPLVRRDLPVLIRRLAAIPGIRDLVTKHLALLSIPPRGHWKNYCRFYL